MVLESFKVEVQRRFTVLASAFQDYQAATMAALNEAEALLAINKKESEKNDKKHTSVHD